MGGNRQRNNDSFYITLIFGAMVVISLIRGCGKEDTYNHASDADVNVIR